MKKKMSRNWMIDWAYENKWSIILTIVVIVLFILLCYSLPSGERLKAMAEKAKADYEQYQATKVDRWKQEYCVWLSEEECSDLIIEFKKEEFKEKNYWHPLTATEYFILR